MVAVVGRWVRWITQLEQINFLLTNLIPRRLATTFMGWFSRIENPLVRGLSLRAWGLFADDLDLSDARTTHFKSLHACFIRELREGARPVEDDPRIITSPCDAIVGACGRVDGTTVLQTKGSPYPLEDLLGGPGLVDKYRDGTYVTLRLRSTMYHRFHAPCDARLREVTYISGDTWNVNPIALRRVERLYCKNERAVLDLELDNPREALCLVPVAAILVASIRLHCLPDALDLRSRGANRLPCNARYVKGDEMGYFQHGSTIIVFAGPTFTLHPTIRDGAPIRAGRPLLTRRTP